MPSFGLGPQHIEGKTATEQRLHHSNAVVVGLRASDPERDWTGEIDNVLGDEIN
jgi:hypothetical protein